MLNLCLLALSTSLQLHFIGVGYAGVVNVRYMAMAHESGVVGGLFKWWLVSLLFLKVNCSSKIEYHLFLALQPYMEIAEIIGRLQSQVSLIVFFSGNRTNFNFKSGSTIHSSCITHKYRC